MVRHAHRRIRSRRPRGCIRDVAISPRYRIGRPPHARTLVAGSMDDMQPSTRVVADRYLLLERIGEGGRAVVHRAHDQLLDRDVAIKLIRPEYAEDRDFVDRFGSEARNAAALHDPRIVTIFDRGID